MTNPTNTVRRSICIGTKRITQGKDGSVPVRDDRTGASETVFHRIGDESDTAYTDAMQMAQMEGTGQ